jgi:hypothetical protein
MSNEYNSFPVYNEDYSKQKIDLDELKISQTKYHINYRTVEKLMSFGINLKQLAEFMCITENKLKKLIKEDESLKNAIDKGKADLKISILTGQLRAALPDPENNYIGNAALLKYLGKVHLGQTETVEVENDGDVEIVLSFGAKKKDD